MLTWVKKIFHGPHNVQEEQRWWDARVAALETIFGTGDGTVRRASTELHQMGFADVMRFRAYINGVTYVTCSLIGNRRQVPNKWGQYELMICSREDQEWAPALISRLAAYTY